MLEHKVCSCRHNHSVIHFYVKIYPIPHFKYQTRHDAKNRDIKNNRKKKI